MLNLLSDGQRSLEERLCLGVVAIGAVEQGKIVYAGGRIRMRLAQPFVSATAEVEDEEARRRENALPMVV
jgi:hypothetical protein